MALERSESNSVKRAIGSEMRVSRVGLRLPAQAAAEERDCRQRRLAVQQALKIGLTQLG